MTGQAAVVERRRDAQPIARFRAPRRLLRPDLDGDPRGPHADARAVGQIDVRPAVDRRISSHALTQAIHAVGQEELLASVGRVEGRRQDHGVGGGRRPTDLVERGLARLRGRVDLAPERADRPAIGRGLGEGQ